MANQLLLVVSVCLIYFRGALSQGDENWQYEYDLYQCGTLNEQPGCFCGYLEDRLLVDKNVGSAGESSGPSACFEGNACTSNEFYPCSDVELLSVVGLNELNSVNGGSNDAVNDLWGWADPNGSMEVAIIGAFRGTAFVDVTDPTQPLYLGTLPSHNGVGSSWRDMKTYGNHVFIISEATNHGMQVFDLTELRTASIGTSFSETTHYSLFGSAHNIFIHEETAVAYVVGIQTGTLTCAGGLHMIDISNPTSPQFIACYSDDGYTHDVQCVIYQGNDTRYTGKEICFACNEDTVTVLDVTNKTAPVMLSRRQYSQRGYTHQGWLTEDHNYFLFGDESDERRNPGLNTRTLVLDVSDLENTNITGSHIAATGAIDHNLYVMGQYVYQANYRAGLRILEMVDLSAAQLEERAFFDIFPADDRNSFNGAWSTYPYLPSGIVLLSVMEQGLFVLRWNPSGTTTLQNECIRDDPPAQTDRSCNFGFGVYCFLKSILLAILDFITFWD